MNTPVPEMKTCKQCGQPMAGDAPEGLCARCLLSAAIKEPSGSGGGTPDPLPSPAPTDIAAQFPELEILSLLGRGGMGVVYKARQPALDRLVALKILTPEFAGDPQFAERFTREARALARLSHPNIVAVHEFGQRDGHWYFLMEFVDGTNLRQLIAAHGILPEQALAIVPKICEALQFAHEEGVMHRDIKPENILVDKKGRVKIADFGLAKLLGIEAPDSALTHTGMSLGTPRYMAPEQVEHPETVDHRADIYSLGVVFYEMLTGELPMGRFAPPSETAGVDVRLDDVVLRSLEKNVNLRYQQASEVKTDVENIAGIIEKLPPHIRAMMGYEYRSKTTLFGWPLLHMAFGPDPKTGKRRVARGIIAMGDMARGVVAFGGLAMGVFAFGGIGIGLVTFSGLALGLISIGGLAIGLLFANGGIAIAPYALGGLALGWLAVGGAAFGEHAAGGYGGHDPLATAFMNKWHPRMNALFFILLPFAVIVPMAMRVLAKRWAAAGPTPPPPTDLSRGTTASMSAPVDTAPVVPRCSRFAIWGAIWAGAFLLTVPVALASWFMLHVDVPANSTPPRPPLVIMLLALLAIPGIAAPIGTTIFGGLAINHIRHSGGKLYGLPLAVADLLFFPLIIIGALISAGSGLLINAVIHIPNAAAIEMMIVGSLPALAICFYIARVAWRWVAGSVKIEVGAKQETVLPTASRPSRRRWGGAILALLLLSGIIFVAVNWHEWHTRWLVPRLTQVSNGIALDFTVPAGQVATFEVVTRKDNTTVPIPGHCAYVVAPTSRSWRATLHWRRDPNEPAESTQYLRRIDLVTEGGSASSGGFEIPKDLAQHGIIFYFGPLSPDQEIIRWAGVDGDHLPANGQLGLRTRTFAHGLKAGEPASKGGFGVRTIDWNKLPSTINPQIRKYTKPEGSAPALERETPSKAASVAPVGDTTALKARLNAALAIAGTEARETALRQVALDAATARDSALTKQVLERISGVELKEKTAEACALDLAKQGDINGAQEVARVIAYDELRDRTLKAIAQSR